MLFLVDVVSRRRSCIKTCLGINEGVVSYVCREVVQVHTLRKAVAKHRPLWTSCVEWFRRRVYLFDVLCFVITIHSFKSGA